MKLKNVLKSIQNNGPRVAVGLVFFVFGLNGFLNFFTPPAPDAAANGFLTGLASAAYFFPLLKAVEVTCGALLLWGRYTALALTLLAPVVVNIVAFHAFLDPSGLVLAAVVALLYVHLVWQNRQTLSILVEK